MISMGSDDQGMRLLRTLRTARLLRTLRVLRLVRFVRALRTLVHSILNTLKNLVWAMLLLTIIIFLYSMFIAQAVSTHLVEKAPSIDASCDDYFQDTDFKLELMMGSLSKTMLTLFKSVSGGMNWELAAYPLAEVGDFWVFVFVSYIVFVVFAVLNVVTGVFCHSAIQSAENDREM